MSTPGIFGAQRRSEYHALADAERVTIQDGDEVSVTSDKYPGTILVRIDGAHLGERTLVLPYGSQLKDALSRLKPAPLLFAGDVEEEFQDGRSLVSEHTLKVHNVVVAFFPKAFTPG